MGTSTIWKLTDADIARIASKVVELLKSEELVTSERVMNAKEAAAYLHISTKRLYNLKDEIPRKKVGKRCYYTEKSLIDYLYR